MSHASITVTDMPGELIKVSIAFDPPIDPDDSTPSPLSHDLIMLIAEHLNKEHSK